MNLQKMRSVAGLAFLLSLFASPLAAHDGVEHKSVDEAVRHQQETAPNTPGFPNVKGGDYALIDQDGHPRTSKSPEGTYQLVFFGYANCKAICSVALPRMIGAVELLENEGIKVTPVLITVDPERDTVANMKPAVRKYHPRMVGLTGSKSQLQTAYDAFQVETSLVYEHPEEGPIYAHGSFIYLLDETGNFKTLLPPVLGPERIAEVTKSYISESSF